MQKYFIRRVCYTYFLKVSHERGEWCDFRPLKGEMKSSSVLAVHVDFSSPAVRAEGAPLYALGVQHKVVMDTKAVAHVPLILLNHLKSKMFVRADGVGIVGVDVEAN